MDGRGVTWFGTAESAEKPGRRWPVIRVRVGRRVADVPARDVSPWPNPNTPAAGPRRPTPSLPRPRTAPESQTAADSPFVLGAMVALTQSVNDGWRRRVRSGSRGVIIGRVRPGEFIVQFTSGRATMVLTSQLRLYTPPIPGVSPCTERLSTVEL